MVCFKITFKLLTRNLYLISSQSSRYINIYRSIKQIMEFHTLFLLLTSWWTIPFSFCAFQKKQQRLYGPCDMNIRVIEKLFVIVCYIKYMITCSSHMFRHAAISWHFREHLFLLFSKCQCSIQHPMSNPKNLKFRIVLKYSMIYWSESNNLPGSTIRALLHAFFQEMASCL